MPILALASLVSGTVLATLGSMKRAFVKRAVLGVVFLSAITTLSGCPIYSHDDDGCWRDRDCADGYLCDDRTGVCYVAGSGAVSGSCVRPNDCASNYTCNPSGQCVSGDCSFNGCVAGYHCDASSGIWQCVSNSVISTGGGSGTGGEAASAGNNAGGAAGSESSSDGAGAGSGGEAAIAGTSGAAGEGG